MKKILYWIDDDHDQNSPPKNAAKKRLEDGLNVTLETVRIEARDGFSKLLPSIDPDLTSGVIMDYQLTKVGENGHTAFGNTWAAEIRAEHPSVPVIGISHEPEKNIPKLRLEAFLAFFPRNDLMGTKPPLQNISALLNGYAKVCERKKSLSDKSGVEIMLELVNPPKTAEELVSGAIPSSLRGAWDVETPHTVGRWLWHDLQGLPGLLFNELSLATYLGLNMDGFRLVESRLVKARYTGAFASDARPRWWTGEVRGIVEKIVGAPINGLIAHSRNELLKKIRVKESDRKSFYSVTHGRKASDIPDCVAYRDDQREEQDRIQTLFEDTVVDERDANPAFGFEPRRIFSPRARA